MNDSSDLEIPIPSVRWYWCVLRQTCLRRPDPSHPFSVSAFLRGSPL